MNEQPTRPHAPARPQSKPQTRILVLEPFGGGSHATFYRQWASRSRHAFTLLELPPVHWKWRSRHAALTFSSLAQPLVAAGQQFDAVFCSSMLNVAEWRGLAPAELARLPVLTYFHENQFTYPLADNQPRDYHYAYNNLLSALCSDLIWFNSHFHLQSFYAAAEQWLRKMPDYPHLDALAAARGRSKVCYPGIDLSHRLDRCGEPEASSATTAQPPVLGWVARWEHDKAPEVFVDAIEQLLDWGVAFRLCLLGQKFRQAPACLAHLKKIAADHIVHDGYADSPQAYWRLLGTLDIVVSTARHEFFGIGVLEAILAGAWPLLPDRLAYPEVLGLGEFPQHAAFLYDAEGPSPAEQLATQLRRAVEQWPMKPAGLEELQLYCSRYSWDHLAARYDDELQNLTA